MRLYGKSAVLAMAVCTATIALGGFAAHADNADRRDDGRARPAAVQSTTPGTPHVGTASRVAAKRVCGPPYVVGDPDLGPKLLPWKGWLGGLLRGYKPLGRLSPQHFLSRYWDYAANDYRYPPNSGFARSGNFPNGRLLIKQTILQPGMKVDRFGGYGGAYLSPLGVPFTERALPPRNLNTNAQDPLHLCNYHAFRVLKSFRVDSGPAAPAFEQEGGATQYHLLSRYVPGAPQSPEELPVSWLLQNGYLEEIEPATALDDAGHEAADDDTGRESGRGPHQKADGSPHHETEQDPRHESERAPRDKGGWPWLSRELQGAS